MFYVIVLFTAKFWKKMPTLTLLVTVLRPFKTIDLELPGDVPVRELIPLLLEICDSQENDPQKVLQAYSSLQIEGTPAPLLLDRTLIESYARDGDVLVLQTRDAPSTPDAQFAYRNLRSHR